MRALDVDKLAIHLARWGSVAKSMPIECYMLEGITYPLVIGRTKVGDLLPGIGLVLKADKRKLGITKKVPGVFDRTPYLRTIERAFRSESAAILSYSNLRTAYQATKLQTTRNDSTAYLNGDVSGAWFTTFDAITAGNWTNPGQVCTRSSPANAWNAQMMDPPSGTTPYLVGISQMLTGTSTTNNGFAMGILVDFLVESGNIDMSLSSTGPFTFSTPALTRYTSGVGNYMNFTAMAANQINANAGTIFTVSYKNQAGSTASSTFGSQSPMAPGELTNDLNGTTNFAAPMFPFAAGDYGCQSITSITLNQVLNNTTNGNAGVFIYRPLVFCQPIFDVGVTLEKDIAVQPDRMTIPLAVDGSGKLGYLTMLYCVSGIGTNFVLGPSAQLITTTLDFCWN